MFMVRIMVNLLIAAGPAVKNVLMWLSEGKGGPYCKALALDVVLIWVGLCAKRMRGLGEI